MTLEVSQSAAERARKAYSAVLQRLQAPGIQSNLAIALGVSESTVSRIKTDKLEDAIALITQLGFKVVPENQVCVDRAMYEALTTIASKAMADDSVARRLMWGGE
jgi:DNA-binding XRE family transcriptional regulator